MEDIINEIPFFVKNHFMKYGKIHKKSRFFSISFNIVDFTKSYGIIEIKNEKGFLRDIIFFGETLSPVLKRLCAGVRYRPGWAEYRQREGDILLR